MLRVRLLGELAVETAEGELVAPRSRPARELLAWLALHPGMHPRLELASPFWPAVLPTTPPPQARDPLLARRARDQRPREPAHGAARAATRGRRGRGGRRPRAGRPGRRAVGRRAGGPRAGGCGPRRGGACAVLGRRAAGP